MTGIFYSVAARKSRAFESDSSLKSDEPRREQFRQIRQHFSPAHRNLLPGSETEDKLRPLLSLNLFIVYHHSQCITALTVCCVIGWAFFTHGGDGGDGVNFLLGSLGSPPSQRCCEGTREKRWKEEETFSCTIFKITLCWNKDILLFHQQVDPVTFWRKLILYKPKYNIKCKQSSGKAFNRSLVLV